DYGLLREKCDRILLRVADPEIVVARRDDGQVCIGERYAAERNYRVRIFTADRPLHGRQAIYLNYTKAVAASDAGIVFWDGQDTMMSVVITFLKIDKRYRVLKVKKQ